MPANRFSGGASLVGRFSQALPRLSVLPGDCIRLFTFRWFSRRGS